MCRLTWRSKPARPCQTAKVEALALALLPRAELLELRAERGRELRQAQKGRIRVGPIERRATGETPDIKVLALRMTSAEVEALDEARRRLGFRSRTAMLKKAIADLLETGCTT